MIKAENLSKYYGDVPAIKDVSFHVEKGEILGLLGPNAAGKTTTMRILTCFFPPTSGRAIVAGYDVFKDSLEVRRRIGYLPEGVPLYTDMPVSSYLSFVAEVKGVPRRDRSKEVAAVMKECSIEDVSDTLIGKLSKGYKQRVGLAQALLHDPEVLILDEPTIGLDPRQIIEIRELIKQMAGKRTVILSTHILPEVSMTCQRVVIINEGKVIAVDTPERLTSQLQKSTQIFLEVEGPRDEVTGALEKVHGVMLVAEKGEGSNGAYSYLVETRRDLDVRRELAAAIVQKKWGLLELRAIELSLEDVFIRLVTEEQASEEEVEA